MFETRSHGHLSVAGRTVTGHAAVFNAEAVLGDFREVIRQGAFSQTLGASPNIRALYEHDSKHVLGTTRAQTLRLKEDTKGLAFELDLPNTQAGNDVAELIRRGDVAGCSFGFMVPEGGDRWTHGGDKPLRELREVNLVEITLTSAPAYADTSLALRSLAQIKRANLNELWLSTCN